MNILLKSFYKLLFITFLVSFILSFLIFFIPLDAALIREQKKAFENAVTIKANTDNFIFTNYMSMAQSQGSRSALKQKLLEYHLGSVGLSELSAFSAPKYSDGAVTLKNLTGAGRYLPEGTLVTSWGDIQLLAQNTQNQSGIYLLSGSDMPSFLVVSRIEEKGDYLGYDACIFNGEIMVKNETDTVATFKITDSIPSNFTNTDMTRTVPLYENNLFLIAQANKKMFFDATAKAVFIVIVYSFALFLFISIFSYFTFFRFVKKLINEHVIVNTKVKSLLAEKELILKEVHHRIKNNMNTIYGLLVLQAETLKDTIAIKALEDSGNRIQSMMLLYDKLYRSANFTELSLAEYLVPLIDEVVSNFPNGTKIKIEKHIDDFLLEVTKLQPLGIIINELLTNIMKYAFVGRSDGVITVTSTLAGNRVTLIIADNGNGIPQSVSFDKSTGFGLILVNGLTQQLGGTIKIERGQETKIVLEFVK